MEPRLELDPLHLELLDLVGNSQHSRHARSPLGFSIGSSLIDSFRFAAPPTLRDLDEGGLVIHLGTFSKTLAAGLRLGWVLASQAIVDHQLFRAGRKPVFMAIFITSKVIDSVSCGS
jgi:hypothetical protein